MDEPNAPLAIGVEAPSVLVEVNGAPAVAVVQAAASMKHKPTLRMFK